MAIDENEAINNDGILDNEIVEGRSSDADESDDTNVFHIFPIFTEKRDALQQYLKDNEIMTIIHYPIPPHKQACYKDLYEFSFPVTEKIHDIELSLPMSPCLTDEQVCYVIEKLNDWK